MTNNKNRQNFYLLISLALAVFIGSSLLGNRLNTFWDRVGREVGKVLTLRGGSVGERQEVVTEQRVVTQEEAVISVVEKSSPAVVSVVTRQVYLDFYRGPVSEEASIGTGFIIDKGGTILTNKHVVADEEATYTVVTTNEKSYEVKSIIRDPLNDIAILKIDGGDLPTLPLGDSAKIRVGQTVVAIGNALGRFSNTVTTGVISGIGRGVTAGSAFDYYGQGEVLEDVFQTDAALNPGNSGGPLLNLSGEVVGINVAISSDAQNIGFSIPINAVKKAIGEYRETGKISQPYLGVSYQMITEDVAKLRRLPVGVFIEEVIKESAADKAGLEPGDIITAIDGNKINRDNSLAKIIRGQRVGEKIILTIDRAGEVKNLTATLGEAPSR